MPALGSLRLGDGLLRDHLGGEGEKAAESGRAASRMAWSNDTSGPLIGLPIAEALAALPAPPPPTPGTAGLRR